VLRMPCASPCARCALLTCALLLAAAVVVQAFDQVRAKKYCAEAACEQGEDVIAKTLRVQLQEAHAEIEALKK
jgi:hypothetical protein